MANRTVQSRATAISVRILLDLLFDAIIEIWGGLGFGSSRFAVKNTRHGNSQRAWVFQVYHDVMRVIMPFCQRRKVCEVKQSG